MIYSRAFAERHFKSILVQVKIIHEARMQLRDLLSVSSSLFLIFSRRRKESSLKCPLIESNTERQARSEMYRKNETFRKKREETGGEKNISTESRVRRTLNNLNVLLSGFRVSIKMS